MKGKLIISFVLLSLICSAQTGNTPTKKKQYISIATDYYQGSILPTTDFVKGDNLSGKPIKDYQSASIKVLWQNPGYTDWQKVYRCPYVGVGTSLGNFYNLKEIGLPVSHFGILGIPVFRTKYFDLYSEFQYGLAWGWKYYNPVSNPKNLVIGGRMTVHTAGEVIGVIHLSKNFDLGTGLSFIHFSNGGFERPNRGFNIYSPSVELKYHFSERAELKNISRPGRLARYNEFFVMAGYGDHQQVEHELDSNYFAIIGLSLIYFDQLSNAFRLGLGSDLNYWMGLTALPDGTIGPRNFDNLTIGLIAQPEFIIDKVKLVGGFGIYARHLKYGNFKQTYQRLGVKYEFYKNLSVGVNIRAINFVDAEFFEFNIAYSFKHYK